MTARRGAACPEIQVGIGREGISGAIVGRKHVDWASLEVKEGSLS